MNFTQFLLILNARKWIILAVIALLVGTTAGVSLSLPKEYSAVTTLIVDAKSKDPVTGQLVSSFAFPGYMATQTEIITSPKVAKKVVHDLKLAENPAVEAQFKEATEGRGDIEQWMGERLLGGLKAEPSRESSTIDISFSGADPRFASILANAFAKAYIDTSLELKIAPARQAADWFDQQITQLRSNLDTAQQKLTAYQREQGLVESEERLDVETRRMGDLSAQIVAAQAASFDANSRTRDGRAMPEVFNSPIVQNLKIQIVEAESRLESLSNRLGVKHPEYLRAQGDLEGLRVKLNTEFGTATRGVGATASATRQRLADLQRAFSRQKNLVLELKQQREKATLLARDLENAQRIYDVALQRNSQTRLEAQSIQTDIAVLNPAVPPTAPSGPRVILNILLSLFLGTLLGVGVGSLVELLDRRVRSSQDIVGLEIPVLAEVTKRGRRLEALRRMFRRNRPAMA